MAIYINGAEYGAAASVAWADITGKPSVFTPDDHSAAKITSGTVGTARLGSGTANGARVLLGDQSWGVHNRRLGSEFDLAGETTVLSATSDYYLGMGTTNTLVDGQLRGNAIVIPYSMTLTGVTFVSATAGAFVGDNNNKVALFTSDGTNLTCVAATANDETIWKGTAHARITKAFSSTYNASPGIYWIAALYNNSTQTTAPAIRCHANLGNAAHSSIFFSGERLAFTINRTDIVATNTFTWASTANSTAIQWFGVY